MDDDHAHFQALDWLVIGEERRASLDLPPDRINETMVSLFVDIFEDD